MVLDHWEWIHGISGKRFARLHRAKISSFAELLTLDKAALIEILLLESEEEAVKLQSNIQLFKDRSLRVLDTFMLPPIDDVVFFDLEATASTKQLFLATFATEKTGYTTFMLDDFQHFLQDIADYFDGLSQTVLVASSGNNWDYNILLNLLEGKGTDGNPVRKFQGLDLMKYLRHKLQSPVGFSVKKLSKYVGHTPVYDPVSDPRMNRLAKKFKYISLKKKTGYLIGKAYESGSYTDRERQAFIDYNIEDVRALRAIYKVLAESVAGQPVGTIIAL